MSVSDPRALAAHELPAPVTSLDRAAWEAEVARRARAAADGTAELIAWEDVDAELDADLRAAGCAR